MGFKLTNHNFVTGKVWPEHSESTQEKYREMFVNHTVETLPTITRSVQVSMMAALYNFSDKLILTKKDSLCDTDKQSLKKIVDKVLEAVRYSLGRLKKIIVIEVCL